MLEEFKELVDLIQYLNDYDETYHGNLRMMNSQLVYTYVEDARMKARVLNEKEDVIDLIGTLDFRKACVGLVEED